MKNFIHCKNLELFKILKQKNYPVSIILHKNQIKYIILIINKKKIFINYDNPFYNMGELYIPAEKIYSYSLGYSYGFKQLPDNIINQYLSSTTTDCNSGYICDLDEYGKAFNYWLNHFGYVEKTDYKQIKKVAHGEARKENIYERKN